MERVQTLVVGAGVVGLACARALARSGREVVIADAASAIGTGTSSRNSEVVHAGIYYPAGSYKARHCVQGATQLLKYCKDHNIAHNVCGKFIVATTEAQRQQLASIKEHAAGNGVELRDVSSDEVRETEPEVSCVAALHSPRTAVVDSHGFMASLQGEAEDAGAMLALKTRILPGGQLLKGGGVRVELDGMCIEAQEVVNCAGLAAQRTATYCGVAESQVPPAYFCKGSYYALQGLRPFTSLIYPVPEKNTSGLGVHATVDLAGNVRFGPDVEWLKGMSSDGEPLDQAAYNEDTNGAGVYVVDPARSTGFYDEVRKYWPGLPQDSLVADYSGIRPKLSAPGQPAADFLISEHHWHGAGGRPSFVSLYGIESPGLTSSLSIADEVLERLDRHASKP